MRLDPIKYIKTTKNWIFPKRFRFDMKNGKGVAGRRRMIGKGEGRKGKREGNKEIKARGGDWGPKRALSVHKPHFLERSHTNLAPKDISRIFYCFFWFYVNFFSNEKERQLMSWKKLKFTYYFSSVVLLTFFEAVWSKSPLPALMEVWTKNQYCMFFS